MKKKALVVVAVVALGVLTVATYQVYSMHATRARIVALLADATERLRATLAARDRPVVVGREVHATALDSHITTLRGMKTASVSRFADAADDALVTGREIMKRQADIDRLRRSLAANVDQLAQHMKSDRGAATWTRDAVSLKAAVDKDSRDYRIAVESYASLLESYPASQARLASYVSRELFIDDKLLKAAREQALEAFGAEEQNVRRVTAIQSYRLGSVRTR